MTDKTMKDKGMIVQIAGVVFLFLGLRGFFVFTDTNSVASHRMQVEGC